MAQENTQSKQQVAEQDRATLDMMRALFMRAVVTKKKVK